MLNSTLWIKYIVLHSLQLSSAYRYTYTVQCTVHIPIKTQKDDSAIIKILRLSVF